MRVKLTYTADVEDVLTEAANLLQNFAQKMNSNTELYKAAVENLQSSTFNPAQLHHNLDLLRRQLGELDIRLVEVMQIVDGYEQYQRSARLLPPDMPEESMGAPAPEEENEDPREEVLGDY